MTENNSIRRLALGATRAAVRIAREANMPLNKPFPSKAELSRMPKERRKKFVQAKTLGSIANNLEGIDFSQS